jgi:hypothetical protein
VSGDAQWHTRTNQQGDGQILVAQVSAVSGAGQLTISIDGNGVESGAACTISSTELIAHDLANGGSTSVAISLTSDPLTLVAWRSVTGTITRVANVTCRVTQGEVTQSAEQVLSDDTILGNQAIVGMNIVASVDSLMVYTSPGPKTP